MIEERIDQDLKKAMLDRNTEKVSALRNLKSTLLYYKISKNIRNEKLPDQETISLLSKEAKKRQESADLFLTGRNDIKARQELNEKKIIEVYLPKMLDENEIVKLTEKAIKEFGSDKSKMGIIISKVKESSQGLADGSTVAKIVREKLT